MDNTDKVCDGRQPRQGSPLGNPKTRIGDRQPREGLPIGNPDTGLRVGNPAMGCRWETLTGVAKNTKELKSVSYNSIKLQNY